MAAHNCGPVIDRSVNSVFNQTLTSLELIVVNDASTDGTERQLARLAAQDDRLHVINCATNVGPGAARNLGLDAARGEWIAIVDSDDLIHPQRLETLLAAVGPHSAVADDLLFFSDAPTAIGQRLLENTNLAAVMSLDADTLLARQFMNTPNALGYLKPMFQRDALGALRYREDLRIGEDFDLIVRFTLAGHAIALHPLPFYLYRRAPGSLSHRLSPEHARAMSEALSDLLNHPKMSAFARASVHARIDALSDTACFEAMVAQAKSRQIGNLTKAAIVRPDIARRVLRTAAKSLRNRLATGHAAAVPGQHPIQLPPRDNISAANISEFVAQANPTRATGPDAPFFNGFLPEYLGHRPPAAPPKVHVRVPTYKRPDALRRALQSLQDQTQPNWVCEVFDDCADASTAEVVDSLEDPRIRYVQNPKSLKASANIDQCFSKRNPFRAEYFCVLEDDNQLLPRFFEDNIAVCTNYRVEIVLRNQLVETGFMTDQAATTDWALLDDKFCEGRYAPDTLRLSLMADMGVSNGGLFWSHRASSDLEVHVPCSATLQEYLRTMSIVEPIYVAMEPLAIWAENGASTTRDAGTAASWFRRELSLKRSVVLLQREIWRATNFKTRALFLDDQRLRYPRALRADGLVKSHAWLGASRALPVRRALRLMTRGLMIRTLGRPERGVFQFLKRLRRLEAG